MTEVKHPKKRSEKEGMVNFSKEMISALGTALIFIIYIIQAFVIPTGSMEKSLLIGDFLLGLKFMYGAPVLPNIPKVKDTYWKFPGIVDPKRGDVVIFKFPGKSGENYIKRCIAVPGDTVRVEGKKLYVNNFKQIAPPDAQWVRRGNLTQIIAGQSEYSPFYYEFDGITNFESLYVPKEGDTLDIENAPLREYIFYKNLVHQEHPYKKITEKFSLMIDGLDYSDSLLFIDTVNVFNETDKAVDRLGFSHNQSVSFRKQSEEALSVYHDRADWTQYVYYFAMWKRVLKKIYGDRKIQFTHKMFMNGKEISSYVTKKESYFMMGDNRDNSADSRYWGFVNRNFVKAKAAIIYFSLDKDVPFYLLPAKIRWNRMGKLIRNFDGMPKEGQPVDANTSASKSSDVMEYPTEAKAVIDTAVSLKETDSVTVSDSSTISEGSETVDDSAEVAE